MSPPSFVVEADKYDGVIFQPLTLMDGHHGDLIDPFERVEAGRPARRAIGASEEMDAKSFKNDLELVADAIFGIGSDDRIEIQIVKNPSDEVKGALLRRDGGRHVGAQSRYECGEARLDLGRARVIVWAGSAQRQDRGRDQLPCGRCAACRA